MITGNEHPVNITGLGALLNDLLKALNVHVDNGVDGAEAHRDAVQAQIGAGVGDNPSGLPDTNMWGILLNEEFSVGEFSEDDSNGTTNCVDLENVTVCGLKTKINQTVGMFRQDTGALLKDAPGFTMRWKDAYSDAEN